MDQRNPNPNRRTAPARAEPLEGRVLLHAGHDAAFAARINFQPAGAAVPSGYVADTGAAYGVRGNGFTYGWNADNAAAARDRNAANSPDQRYDTLTHTQLFGERVWELAVPNGSYTVRVVAGDPTHTDAVYKFNAEGVLTASGTPTLSARWVEGTKTVAVSDNRLTISNAAGASNNKLCFVEITQVAAAPSVAVPGTIQAENYDAGGQNVAYFDTTAQNLGGQYRPGDAVDIGAATDTGGGYFVGWTAPGEFLRYAVHVHETGTYTLEARVASGGAGGTFHVQLGTANVSGQMTLPNTGGWQAWKTLTKTNVQLTAGDHSMRLVFDTLASGAAGVGNVNWLRLTKTQPPAPVPPNVFAWEDRAGAPLPLYEAQGTTVGNKLYLFGGYTSTGNAATRLFHAYDATANTWTRLPDAPEALTHAAVTADGTTIWVAGGFLGNHPGPSTNHVWKYDTAAARWSAGPSLPGERGGGALAVLGRNLHFFGGAVRAAGSDVYADKADHWVLNLNQPTAWSARAAMPNPRNHLGGAALNGRVYAVGGQFGADYQNGNQALVHAYDPSLNRWFVVAGLPEPMGHTSASTVVLGGRLVVAGGTLNGNRVTDAVRAYDPATNTWVALPSLPAARQSPVAGVVGNRLVVATGLAPPGFGGTQTTIWSAVLEQKWETAAAGNAKPAPLPVVMDEVAGGIIGNRMYLVGGGTNSTLFYDLSLNAWGSTTALAQRPYKGNHHAAEVINGRLYLFGGIGGSAEGKVQIYNPATNQWTLGAAMPFAAGSSATAVINGQVYVAGGITGSTTTGRHARYNPVANAWTELAPMPQPRNHAASATDGVRLWVFGGRGPGSGDGNTVANGFNTVQVYNPSTNTWQSSATTTSLAPLPIGRGGMGKAVYANGEFHVIGGETQTGPGATATKTYNRVDIYRPATNTWRLGPAMPTARHGIFPLLHSNRIYVAAGGTSAGFSRSAVLEILNLR